MAGVELHTTDGVLEFSTPGALAFDSAFFHATSFAMHGTVIGPDGHHEDGDEDEDEGDYYGEEEGHHYGEEEDYEGFDEGEEDEDDEDDEFVGGASSASAMTEEELLKKVADHEGVEWDDESATELLKSIPDKLAVKCVCKVLPKLIVGWSPARVTELLLDITDGDPFGVASLLDTRTDDDMDNGAEFCSVYGDPAEDPAACKTLVDTLFCLAEKVALEDHDDDDDGDDSKKKGKVTEKEVELKFVGIIGVCSEAWSLSPMEDEKGGVAKMVKEMASRIKDDELAGRLVSDVGDYCFVAEDSVLPDEEEVCLKWVGSVTDGWSQQRKQALVDHLTNRSGWPEWSINKITELLCPEDSLNKKKKKKKGKAASTTTSAKKQQQQKKKKPARREEEDDFDEGDDEVVGMEEIQEAIRAMGGSSNMFQSMFSAMGMGGMEQEDDEDEDNAEQYASAAASSKKKQKSKKKPASRKQGPTPDP